MCNVNNVEQVLTMTMAINMLVTLTNNCHGHYNDTFYCQEEEPQEDSEELKDEDIPPPSGPEEEW